jgi:hypothetical protein
VLAKRRIVEGQTGGTYSDQWASEGYRLHTQKYAFTYKKNSVFPLALLRFCSKIAGETQAAKFGEF